VLDNTLRTNILRTPKSSFLERNLPRRPIRPKPLTPIPVAIDIEAPLLDAFNDDPEKEDAENAAAELMERAATESFIVKYLLEQIGLAKM